MIRCVLVTGDCLDNLRRLPTGRAQTCVTSPPYWGLRDYEMDGQIGLEETLAEYIARLVDVFREVRRVLRSDGTLWLNLGDSYVGSWGAQGHPSAPTFVPRRTRTGSLKRTPGLRNKDMLGVPWRVAFALQADGWILRQDIIWHKSNPMPESVKDRCTKAHEYMFLLSPSEQYYFDWPAIREPAKTGVRFETTRVSGRSLRKQTNDGLRTKRSVWTVATRHFHGTHFATFPPALIEPCILAGTKPGNVVIDPFSGAGTTGLVALTHGRRYWGCDLNPNYTALAQTRLDTVAA